MSINRRSRATVWAGASCSMRSTRNRSSSGTRSANAFRRTSGKRSRVGSRPGTGGFPPASFTSGTS
jgi:hypothetical protein